MAERENIMNKKSWIDSETVFALIAKIKAQYPEEVFTPPTKTSPPDAFGAAGARLACDLIRRQIEKYVENVGDEKI